MTELEMLQAKLYNVREITQGWLCPPTILMQEIENEIKELESHEFPKIKES